MRIDIDLEKDTVRAEFSMAEFHEIMDALRAAKNGPAVPQRPTRRSTWRMPVESTTEAGKIYQTRIWFDSDDVKHGACQCGDNVYRRRWCKHLAISDGVRIGQLARLS